MGASSSRSLGWSLSVRHPAECTVPITGIVLKMQLLVGALLKKVSFTNSHYTRRIFSRRRKDPQQVVSVHDYPGVGYAISLGKASLPINSTGIPEGGVNGCSRFGKPLSVALFRIFGLGKVLWGKRLAKSHQFARPQAYEKSGFEEIEKAIAQSSPCLASPLESDGGLQFLFEFNTVLACPAKSFADTLGFDPDPSLIVGIWRKTSAHAFMLGESVEKQRNTRGHVVRRLACIDFSPFPPVERNVDYISQRKARDGDPQKCLRKITPVGQSTWHKDFHGHANTPILWCRRGALPLLTISC
jgi:hypothetical protein